MSYNSTATADAIVVAAVCAFMLGFAITVSSCERHQITEREVTKRLCIEAERDDCFYTRTETR